MKRCLMAAACLGVLGGCESIPPRVADLGPNQVVVEVHESWKVTEVSQEEIDFKAE